MKEISVVGVIAQYCLCDMGGRHRPCGGHVSYVMLRAFRCFAFPVCVFVLVVVMHLCYLYVDLAPYGELDSCIFSLFSDSIHTFR